MMRASTMWLILLLNTLSGCDSANTLFSFISNIFSPSSGPERPRMLDFIGLVNRHGYPAQEYRVTTPDGYQLRIHRVPGSPKSPPALGKPVVYLQHGLLGSSDMFVLAGPGRDLVYILADAGYDVWLGNVRGNPYSRSHVRLSPDRDPKFWDFSFHEMGVYDVTSMINRILKVTRQRSIVYIGHSMGTTIGFVLLSTRPEYNKKVHLVINMASVGFLKQPKNFMKFLKDNGDTIATILRVTRNNEVLPRSTAQGELLNGICRLARPFNRSCKSFADWASGDGPDLRDSKLLLEALFYFPAGASRQNLLHFYQNMKSEEMQMFDYGRSRNLIVYNQETPPLYNLDNIVTPVVLIYGKTDAIASPEDSFDLLDRLRNARAESVPHDKFGHMDFLWAKDIKRLLQDRIVEIIEKSRRNGSFSVL